jgi:hypothetical protein
MNNMMQPLIFLCTFAFDVFAAPSWPTMYTYSPDSLPVIGVKLAPPQQQMAEVSAALGRLNDAREAFEKEHLLEVEAAYDSSLSDAKVKLPVAIDSIMRAFEKPLALVSHGRGEKHTDGDAMHEAASFIQAQASGKPGGHELTARINVLPAKGPDASAEARIKAIERKRAREENTIFNQAVSEMSALTQIVQNEVEAQITRYTNNLLHSVRVGAPLQQLPRQAAGLLSASQPMVASGPQLTTNVRVAASEEPFYTVAALVEDMERQRDASENAIQKRVLELELRLLQAENELVKGHLIGWVARLARTSS